MTTARSAGDGGIGTAAALAFESFILRLSALVAFVHRSFHSGFGLFGHDHLSLGIRPVSNHCFHSACLDPGRHFGRRPNIRGPVKNGDHPGSFPLFQETPSPPITDASCILQIFWQSTCHRPSKRDLRLGLRRSPPIPAAEGPGSYGETKHQSRTTADPGGP